MVEGKNELTLVRFPGFSAPVSSLLPHINLIEGRPQRHLFTLYFEALEKC